MTRANTEQAKFVPWFAKAGAACSIVPLARFIGPNIFALKGGGYGCLFSLTGIDEEGLTDQELDSRMRSIEGALRGLPEGSCLYQYTRAMSGFELPRLQKYSNPVTQVFVDDRLAFLEKTAGFRHIDLHWCLTLEPSKLKAFERKPQENSADTSRMLAELQKAATILEGHLGGLLGLRLLDKNSIFQFFSYLFNLEEWTSQAQLRDDAGVDRQIVSNPVAWHSDHLRVGKRYVQMYSLKTTPEASRPCLFSGLLTLDCDSVLCSTWRPKSTTAARSEIDAQEKFISFFKVGVLTRVMSGRDTASLETGAGAKAANSSVDDLSLVIRELDKKAQGEYSLRLLLAANSAEQLRDTAPAVHRIFVDARAQVIEETLGNLCAFYAMFPGNGKFNVFPIWLSEEHHARLSSVFAPHIGQPITPEQTLLADHIGNEVYASHYAERKAYRLIVACGTVLLCASMWLNFSLARRPLVNRYIRIDEMGRAQAIQYSDLSYSPREGEVRTYLTDWANYRYTISRDTIAKKHPLNYYFLSGNLASQLMTEDNQNHLVSQVIGGQIEQSDVEIKDVTITSMSQETVQGGLMARGTALLALDKLYSPSHSREPRTEHWMLSLTYYLNPKQVSDQAKIYPQYEFINPLGLTITEFHENRVSVDPIAPGTAAATVDGAVR